MKETTSVIREDFEVLEDGTTYGVPHYEVIDGQGIVRTGKISEVCFVRGSKLGTENVEKRTGTLHEHIISMCIHDLKFKNNLVASQETVKVIEKLTEALGWLGRRQIDRAKREVVGTYKK
jgi:hypothetical protein